MRSKIVKLMAHDVFISYSSKNKTTADAICHVLEEQGIKCWIAPRDIVGGEKYGNVIESAIKSCKVFVIIFSEESRISPWVESELNLAFTDRRIIVPFKIDSSVLEGEMRLILNNKHWIEAYPNPELKFKDLIDAVSRSIGKPTLNEAEKHNQEVEKQLEIEKEKLRKEQLQNDKAQKDIEEKTNFTNKSEINTKETITNSQGKKTNFPFIIIMSVIFIGIIIFFISINKKDNNDLSNSKQNTIALVDTAAMDTSTVDTTVMIANNDNNKINSTKPADRNNNKNTELNNKTGTFTDSRDGHVYKWVKIGNQIWMAENLAFKTNDGCFAYNNDENNVKRYGYLYNWETAKKVSPKGWHLPSVKEWNKLKLYLIGNGFNYDKSIKGNYVAKSMASNVFWKDCTKDDMYGYSPEGTIGYQKSRNNMSGFSALPAGVGWRDVNKSNDEGIGEFSQWWTSTEYDETYADAKGLYYNIESLCERGENKIWCFSVRCIKN